MGDIIIQSKDIVRDFETAGGTVHVLKKISVSLERNKLIIFRGRSGSGKTTLINILGSLDQPTSGNVFFNGNDISNIAGKDRDNLRRKDIGFVFQSTALVGIMSAYENVEFAMRVSGFKDAKERKERVLHCLNLVDMAKRRSHMPSEMSGGEQQRIAIARAISHKPQVLFADEPTGALDTQMGLQVMSVFKLLLEKEGVTIIMTTHDPNLMDIADYVYTIEDGVIIDEKKN